MAIVVPLLFSFDRDRILLLVISSAFLVLMVYVWWQSKDVEDPYQDIDEEVEDESEDADLERYADYGDEDEAPPRPRTSRAPPSRAGRFRKREG